MSSNRVESRRCVGIFTAVVAYIVDESSPMVLWLCLTCVCVATMQPLRTPAVHPSFWFSMLLLQDQAEKMEASDIGYNRVTQKCPDNVIKFYKNKLCMSTDKEDRFICNRGHRFRMLPL